MSLKHYKDKEHGRKYREEYKRKYRLRTGSYEYIPRRWSEEEIKAIVEHKVSDIELSKKLHRSVIAIQTKRCKVKTEV